MSARILVVEDTPHTLELMAYLLASRGHAVTSADCGAGAVALSGSEPPDLVVMDIQLAGGFDGFEALRRIRALPGLRSVPIVAVTAFAMVGDREHALRSGFTGYLTKPIDPYTFGTEIERFLAPGLHGHPPVTAQPAAGGSSAPRVSLAPDRPMVLVVDDLPTNIDLTRSILEPFGFRVTTAATVGEAMDSIRSDRPSLVVCDFHLGREYGTELWQLMREEPELAGVPFAFTTATATLLSELPSTVVVIRRPVDPSKFVHKVHELIGLDGVPADAHPY